jgi:hypothetical protein
MGRKMTAKPLESDQGLKVSVCYFESFAEPGFTLERNFLQN